MTFRRAHQKLSLKVGQEIAKDGFSRRAASLGIGMRSLVERVNDAPSPPFLCSLRHSIKTPNNPHYLPAEAGEADCSRSRWMRMLCGILIEAAIGCPLSTQADGEIARRVESLPRLRASRRSPFTPLSAPPCRLDRGDVDLSHRHHRFKCTLGRRAIRVGDRVDESAWRDLPV
jgi:hypothetical protein